MTVTSFPSKMICSQISLKMSKKMKPTMLHAKSTPKTKWKLPDSLFMGFWWS